MRVKCELLRVWPLWQLPGLSEAGPAQCSAPSPSWSLFREASVFITLSYLTRLENRDKILFSGLESLGLL